MPVIDTIAKRMQALRDEGKPDIYNYNIAPEKLRAQVAHILSSITDEMSENDAFTTWSSFEKTFLPEIGKIYVGRSHRARDNLIPHIMKGPDEEVFVFIDVVFRIINTVLRDWLRRNYFVRHAYIPDRAIEELNTRLRESKCGYQFETGVNKLMPMATEFTHEQIVRPALGLLGQSGFEEASTEFLTAYDHATSGKWKDAITAAARSFEATMKAICKKRDWAYKEEMRASDLIKVCRQHGLFPEWLDHGLNDFIAMMNTSVPGIRNKAGAHGSTADFEKVSSDLAMYAIHEAAALILLFLERDKALG